MRKWIIAVAMFVWGTITITGLVPTDDPEVYGSIWLVGSILLAMLGEQKR